jgi:hypothetical protein
MADQDQPRVDLAIMVGDGKVIGMLSVPITSAGRPPAGMPIICADIAGSGDSPAEEPVSQQRVENATKMPVVRLCVVSLSTC